MADIIRCKHCAKPIDRHVSWSFKTWLNRQYCNKDCRGAARKIDTPTKVCEACCKPYTRRANQGVEGYLKSKFCSKECSADSQRFSKKCEFCFKTLKRREDERAYSFRERRFCGRDCANQFNKEAVEKPPETLDQKLFYSSFNPLLEKASHRFPYSDECINGYPYKQRGIEELEAA